MKICKKCGTDVGEESLFCNKCGSKLSTNYVENPLKRKKMMLFSAAIIIIIGIIGTSLILLNNPFTKFKNFVKDNQYLNASVIYNEKIKGDTEEEKKVETFIAEELDAILLNYKNDKIDYQKATSSLETIKKLEFLKSDLETTISNVNKLNDSRTSFKKGQEFINNKKIKDGIIEFNKVITDDENYSKAQELIHTYATEYKNNAIKDAEQQSNNLDYDKAINILDEVLIILPNDSDVIAKKSGYEMLNNEKKALEKKKKMQEAKSKQEVTVDNARIEIQSTEYKTLYPDMIQVIVRNNTSKTVKNMHVSMLGYDNHGLPLKIKLRFNSNNFEFVGIAENVNIVPKATFGKDNGWEIAESHGIKTVLAIVKDVEYYDGSKWENPYYEYWIEENKEKPLH